VTWPPPEAPTPHELRRARAAAEARPDPAPLGAPVTPAVLERLAAHDREPARGVETFAGCGVRWLVDRLLRPERTAPDPEPMTRGSLAHAALERTLGLLRERTGSAALGPGTLDAALDALETVMDELRGSARDVRARASVRVLGADLERYLRHEAANGAGLEPRWLEWSFGGEGDEAGPLELPGAGLAVAGRVDRIDTRGDGTALIRDYKGKTVYPGARWAEDHRLQVALYAVAVREKLGLEPAGALYQPLGAPDARPRGLVRDDMPGRYVNGDVVDAQALDAALDDALAAAASAATDLRAGRIRPCPASCSPAGCAHPGICRATEGTAEAEAAAADAAAAEGGT
jgi:RecB family exonuclease